MNIDLGKSDLLKELADLDLIIEKLESRRTAVINMLPGSCSRVFPSHFFRIFLEPFQLVYILASEFFSCFQFFLSMFLCQSIGFIPASWCFVDFSSSKRKQIA